MPNPAINRFLARLQPQLASSFTPQQLTAIELHFAMRHRASHSFDWRFRLPGLGFYAVLLAGRDNRA